MTDSRTVLFISEPYYLRFYRPLADRLARAGMTPVWVSLGDDAPWAYGRLDPGAAIERLLATRDLSCPPELLDAMWAFERAVFAEPALFEDNYRYIIRTVRTPARAPRLAAAWYHATLALLQRFRPKGVFFWNGRYLPYSAVSAACREAGQPFYTSEIGWIPGTIFLDRGSLSTNTVDLSDRSFEAEPVADLSRADAFLQDYTTRKATMVTQTLLDAADVRQRLLAGGGAFLLLYGCQVDWDTNVVIGSRRFRSNESAVSFLLECLAGLPGARLVVKTHPLDSAKKEEVLRRLLGAHGSVVSDVHPHTLIEAADCVAVRNSTLGFEALCYGKPLLALEESKYRHAKLTLGAASRDEAAAGLWSVARKECGLPDPIVLRQFILHLLDNYLVPDRYAYLFEPAKLELLSHFARNRSHETLAGVLNEAVPGAVVSADPWVAQAIDTCKVAYPTRPSLMRRLIRKLSPRRGRPAGRKS